VSIGKLAEMQLYIFEEIWGRIKAETEVKKLRDLAEEVGTIATSISRKKKNNDFPVEWAFKIAQKYNLSTDWIMTGKGPKRLGGKVQNVESESNYLLQIGTWFKEITFQDSRKKTWFEIQFEKAFPEFVEWLKDREVKKQKAA
jgi:hypothetical protein